MRLSLHDKDDLGKKYVNEPELWIETEEWVREALVEGKLDFEEVKGMSYLPILDIVRLTEDSSVNYIVHARKK